MAGAFFPGTIPFNAFDGGTVTADGEQITASGTEIRSPWINAGALAKVDWALASGTFSSVQMRSSYVQPAARVDACPVFASTWSKQAIEASGLPTAQGWSLGGASVVVTDMGNYISVATTASYGYYHSGNVSQSMKKLSIAYFSFGVPTGSSPSSETQIVFRSQYTSLNYTTIYLSSLKWGGQYGGISEKAMALDTLYDFAVVHRSIDGSTGNIGCELWGRPRGSYSAFSMEGMELWGTFGMATSVTGSSTLTVGVYTSMVTRTIWTGDLGIATLDEWETVTDAQTSFTALGRGWVQIKGTLNGTLTELDIMNSLSAPADLTVAGTAGASGVISALASAADGANTYHWTRTGPSTSDEEYHHQRAYAWADCENGVHAIAVRQCSPDGVKSTNAASANATMPYTAPTVAVTVSAATVAPGGTVTASAVLAGGTTATLGGSAWDGSSQTIVTGVAGAGTAPPGAFSVAMSNAPGAYSISYSGGTMRIYLGAAGDATRDTATLEKSTDGLTSWATDATQGTNPVNYSALTFNGAVVGTSYATDHGWSLTTGTYYRVKLTDVDGRSTYSNALRWAAQSDYECVVSGSLPSPWRDGTKTVSVKLSEAVAIGSQTYATGPYTATVGTDGAWTVTLPRLAAATQVDGGSNALSARFTFPDGTKVSKAIPNSASATFESLTAV